MTEEDIHRLQLQLATCSPLPWRAVDGRIVSVPTVHAWAETESWALDDPRWASLGDPTVAFYTPAVGRDVVDASLIAEAISMLPALLARLRQLESARDEVAHVPRQDHADAVAGYGGV